MVVVFSLTIHGASVQAQSSSLYERLGGMEQIVSIVNETIERTSSDPLPKRSFEGINLKPVKAQVAIHLCEMTGGPCKFDGASMAQSHSGLAITSLEFDIMDTYLAEALDRRGVSQAIKQELQGLLGPMKSDIVGR